MVVIIKNFVTVIIIAKIYEEEKSEIMSEFSRGFEVKVTLAAAGHPAYKFVMLCIKDLKQP